MAKSYRALRARMSLDAQARAAQQAHAMRDTPTPGQIAYDAWWTTFGDGRNDPPYAETYATLSPRAQQSWEAAAQAVLAQCTPPEDRP
jgi:hypothetical protein